jgi:hypothetical protein
MPEIKLGNEVRCKVTGLKGIATAKVYYINGCVQFCVTPRALNDEYPKSTYLDVKQLEYVGEGVEISALETGGPQQNCPSH